MHQALFNLRERWQPISTAIRDGERVAVYRYGKGKQRLFLLCRNNLRRGDVLSQVVDVTVERDVGGIVVTLWRVASDDDARDEVQSLSQLVARVRRGAEGGASVDRSAS
ncbi:hypothetical protein HC891_03165 [Candidatus Gracilibacteria bacterium]|nr:hypothetical protein [Candidatus Gracilibacteria bacterium]